MPMVVMNEGVKLSSLNRSRVVLERRSWKWWMVGVGVDVVRESHSCGFGLPWRGQSVGESDSGWRYKGRRRQWEGKSESDGISADGEFTGQDSRG
jgi:hypothetical protein